MEELKIIEPIQNGLKSFKTTDEFNLYFSKHKAEMENMTTQKLNKLYKIDGYRITKINTRDENGKLQKGQICLKRFNEKQENHDENNLYDQIDLIKQRLDELTNTVNKIIEALNEE